MGFDQEEIKNTKTADLILLKRSIVPYLTSKKLKKRNSSFIGLYKRITEELKSRQEISLNANKITLDDADKQDEANSTRTDARSDSSKTVPFLSGIEEQSRENDFLFLKRKISANSVLEIEIPSFLHDKRNRHICAKNECSNENEEVNECITGKLFIN